MTTPSTWKSWMWDGAEHVIDAVLEHPFLLGLADGTLPRDRFVYFLAQDAAYLRDYARTLAVVASKAPSHGDTALLASHAADTADVEVALHEKLLPELGVAADEIAKIVVSPTTRAYTSYLLATAHTGTFAEGLAAVLPCYWIYRTVGESLVSAGSPDPLYRAWIDAYGGPDFGVDVDEALDLADRIGPTIAREEAWRTRDHFLTTSRYEWMFWDAAWREEQWPLS